MCRLSGLHAGAPVDAEFWLIGAHLLRTADLHPAAAASQHPA
jgi:hypothetical protein